MSRVLVVEDEVAIAELISLNLRHAGFEVVLAQTGDMAQIIFISSLSWGRSRRGLLPDGAKSYAKPIKRAFRGP